MATKLQHLKSHETNNVEEKYTPVVNIFNDKDVITRKDVKSELNIKTTYAINILKEMTDKNTI